MRVNKIRIKKILKCPICKKKMNIIIIKIMKGKLKGLRKVDKSCCSIKCQQELKKLINEETK